MTSLAVEALEPQACSLKRLVSVPSWVTVPAKYHLPFNPRLYMVKDADLVRDVFSGLRLSGPVRAALSKYKKPKHRTNAESVLFYVTRVVIANALNAAIRGMEFVVDYSRSRPRTPEHPYGDLLGLWDNLDSRNVKIVVDALVEQHYLVGWVAPPNTSVTHKSCFAMQEKLRKLLLVKPSGDWHTMLDYDATGMKFVQLIEDGKSRERLAFGDTPFTTTLELLGFAWSTSQALHRTEHPQEKILSWEWIANSHFAFKGDWYFLGRFFHPLSTWSLRATSGSPKRNLVTVDGEKTVEWDFVSLHINMLYVIATGALYPYADCYQVPHGIYAQDKVMGRKLAKIVCNTGLINNGNVAEALRATNAYVHGYWKPSLKLGADGKPLSSWVPSRAPELRQWLEETGLSIDTKVIEDFLEYHAPIREYLLSDCGLVLQRMDAEIAYRVLAEFVSKKLWILPYHDSFRVKQSNEHHLIKTMLRAFSDVMKVEAPNKLISKKD